MSESVLAALGESLRDYGSGPLYSEMPRHTLENKGMAGSTAAHNIEELHAPLNIAYTTYTTGTTAFQNIVGITHAELSERRLAGKKALELGGAKQGSKVLVTYAPLVNVFSGEPLSVYGLESIFMMRPNRDAFIYALCQEQPQVVLGESSFIRAAIEDAERLDILSLFPENLIFLTAGTPFDMELLECGKKLVNPSFHDLYGCQEFGWLTLDGIPLRQDIELVDFGVEDQAHLVVGGLPTGDVFQLGANHILNPKGIVATYSRVRSHVYWETLLLETMAADASTARRVATSILRIKGKPVRISERLKTGVNQNKLALIGDDGEEILLSPDKTKLFDDLLRAQMEYQSGGKVNPVWNKEQT